MPHVDEQSSVVSEFLAEFLERLPDALPFLEAAVALGRSLVALRKSVATEGPCDSCPRTDCRESCERLEAHLNGPYEGKLHGETTIGANLDEIAAQKTKTRRQDVHGPFQDVKKVTSFDPMEPYERCWHLLSCEQREAVELYYGEGKKVGAIAKLLHRSPSSVSARLRRAKEVKEDYDTKMRRKKYELLRETQASAHEI
jgi:predicted DNA-binding protein YlxM (UPF0122 family)